ncbi:MAG: hypothetical protein LKJ41_05685 [[Lactobacillus] timonensis]|jgi:hypothetical protein|uniref:hypothetical protein n=1 Tax=[Lactobacillus] timonensis TaxID=1970790 RepID=UPI0023576002|nr:hypothetical protein [[Lactobacillus] timonensis]MCI1926452.1 hypothetical protein [[Lactobacillus] timonensis]MCI1957853.1 hypothetical protein [[Lactobacillus] timonensis]
MNNTDTQLQALENRPVTTFNLTDGDQVRLENSIYTAGEYDDGDGFNQVIEDHTADIPFIGEIYFGGKRPSTLSKHTFIKEHDVINFAGQSYMVVRLNQVKCDDCYSLINVDSLKDIIKDWLDLI